MLSKRTWARVEADQGTVVEQGFLEALRRDPEQQMRWVVLTDGQEDLLRQVDAAPQALPSAGHRGAGLRACARIPVEGRLCGSHPEDAEAREGGVKGRAGAVLQGRAQEVAIGLRRAATRKQLSQGQRKPVDKAADYLESNQQRLRYDQALAQGLPIATGVIEGACRHLVKDRMDITGARWGLERAEAILKLRSLKVSGDLPAYLTFHFEQERKRHYPCPLLPQRPAA